MHNKSFPIFPVGTIFKNFEEISNAISLPKLKHNTVTVNFPMRLNGMSIDSSAIALEGSTSFPAGEIFFSIKKFVTVTVHAAKDNKLHISNGYGRSSILRHACLIMCRALKIEPSFDIEIISDNVQIHTGFGTSGATIGAVCAAINEMYGNPIKRLDLIKYIANNYGEEIENDDSNLQLVQCIGGSVASGFTAGGITIIAGDATPIISEPLESEIIIGVPTDFYPKSAKYMMELETQHLDNFEIHGQQHAYAIAYTLLHKGIPLLKNGDISEICDIIYRHRFEMGSIKNCSFVFPRMIDIADNIKYLYTNKLCRLLSMSSVGPAFFIIPDGNTRHEEICIKALECQNLKVFKTAIFNRPYIANYNKEEDLND